MNFDELLDKLKRYENYYRDVDPYADFQSIVPVLEGVIKEAREFLEQRRVLFEVNSRKHIPLKRPIDEAKVF